MGESQSRLKVNIPFQPFAYEEPRGYVWEYRRTLHWFWIELKGSNQEQRIALLRRYAAVRMIFPPNKPYQTRRSKPKNSWLKLRRCVVCLSDADLIRHHVIQIQHGGPPIRQNVVYLCSGCHALIHPWLM